MADEGLLVSEDEIRSKMAELLPTVDLESTGLKSFIKIMSKSMGGIDLKSRKDFIKSILMEEFAKRTKAKNDEDSAEEEEEEDDDDESVDIKPKKRKGGGGLAVKKEISPALQKFLGQGCEMARTEIVKALWEYIRQHDLQNPANKKEILLDPAMKAVFGCDTFTMFSMNKYVSAHIHPFKPVDLTPSSTSKTRSPKRKAGGAGGSATKKARKTGTQPPYRLSETLAEVVGTDILPRPQVVSKIWDYIKAQNLQNPKDKREILCDDKLKRVMGNQSKVTMFNMNTFIGEHLIEKLAKEDYAHPEEDD